ncbi:hypothetical protein [Desulfobaculum bizertense]|uniref:Helix-turn-helix domain-containing protein n=1 Tax=Desulfobaculum bizertense DSM 18034 TaxID=1121442 RepID=A0A1T4VGR1_9BACT|nr:hypothetical protein [Desulfobaculum bizertense]UIJ37792.1 hypothetical protein LWC08_14030 [Desulfobaculum bizertense]SKA64103.1 hypothetical protein SAMN02745702_00264 [Desulfobaculum bizertense DSM 18034]
MEEATHFVHAFMQAIEEARLSQGRSHSDIARAAFPEHRDPVGAYRKIRNSGQNLRMEDAVRLARAVHVDFPALCWTAQQSLK